MIDRRPRGRIAWRVLALAAVGIAGASAAPVAAQPSHPVVPRPGFDVLDYDIQLYLPSTGARIGGRALLTIERRAPADTSLRLDLVDMAVTATHVGATPAAFTQDGAGVTVSLARRVADVDTIRVSVLYAGSPTDGLIIREGPEGWTAFGDNWPTRARHWIPSIDDPSDKATVTWRVTVRPGMEVVANGALVERTPVEGSGRPGIVGERFVWRASKPIPTYLMVVGVARMSKVDVPETRCTPLEQGGCLDQMAYAIGAGRDSVPKLFAKAEEIASLFAELIAPFPYEQLAHVQSTTRFGGMENAGAIFYDGGRIADGTMRPGLIAHEAAHQWFGDAVTPRSFGHVWLSEGFATYLEQLWLERTQGDSARRDGMSGMRATIVGDSSASLRSVVDTTETNYFEMLGANSYQKGAWVLHMLRRQVGDPAFFRGVRAYYSAHRHGNAATGDLLAAMERASAQKLDWFFTQWLHRAGNPRLTVSWSHAPAKKRVTVVVTQPKDRVFRVPLTMDVVGPRGVQRVSVDIPAQASSRIELPIEVSARPTRLVLDPDVDLLAELEIR